MTANRALVLTIAAVVLAILLWPKQHALFNMLTVDAHRSSMCLQSSMYSFSDGLLPVKDIYSQYGAIQGFTCHFLLADGIRTTIDNFNVFQLCVRFIFFFGLFALCLLWLESVLYSSLITIGVFFLQFISHIGFDHTFHAPSMSVYRYPVVPYIGIFLLQFLKIENESLK